MYDPFQAVRRCIIYQSKKKKEITRSFSFTNPKSVRPATYIFVPFDSVENLFGKKFLQMRNRGLRTAPDEAALQMSKVVADAFQADIHLLIHPVIVSFLVGQLVRLVVAVLLLLGHVFRALQVSRLVKLTLSLSFI